MSLHFLSSCTQVGATSKEIRRVIFSWFAEGTLLIFCLEKWKGVLIEVGALKGTNTVLRLALQSKGLYQSKLLQPFLYHATLKSAGYYVIPSVQKFAFERPSVRTSIHQHFVSALHLEHFFDRFSSNFV